MRQSEAVADLPRGPNVDVGMQAAVSTACETNDLMEWQRQASSWANALVCQRHGSRLHESVRSCKNSYTCIHI